ncbi:importin 13, putative [Talaromyces stipitatus ATCC 10500]|uniref:Importin 13, putative n=1 Tax=Talaromyces stipitatus (strain ATCC 10500 / CBS 375.48 / QM 6759 / NRRL 1006) TaxID=441959 RepID=B8M9W1_TALSN|nr:importin 13, putative [Talaromyces stipitatus ATCC 10500]EED18113.1 importin 13, putative [Talaromyces stipitatus ATCC 10500]
MDVAGQATVLDPSQSPQQLCEEAEILVYQLNHPTATDSITVVQDKLQQIQKLPQGWDVARYLLDQPDSGTKFFGALTFIVKINQSWPDLSDDTIQQLKSYLVSCYVTLIESQEKQLVTRKLSAALVAVFFNDQSWTHPIQDIAAFFWQRGLDASLKFDYEGTVVPALNEIQISGLLAFSITMAEDSVRNSSLVRKSSGDHPITESIEDAFCLCNYVLGALLKQYRTEGDVTDKTGFEVLNACQAWFNVRTSIYLRDRSESHHIQSTVNQLLLCMNIPSLSSHAIDILADMLNSEDRLLKEMHLEVILAYMQGDRGKELAQMLKDGDYDDDAMAFWNLIEAYSSPRRIDLITGVLGPSHAVLLTYLDVLFQGPGHPGVDDSISPRLLEWWTETADTLLEGVEQGLEEARQHLAKAVLNVYSRLKWPAENEFGTWTADERSEFYNFRRDTEDFLLSVYSTLGLELFDLFRQKAVSALDVGDWNELEAACFCLAQISEAVDGVEAALDHLNAVFTAEKFTRICFNSDQLPTKTRQTLVDMLGKYQSYFERNPNLLPKVLTFLFSSLNVGSCTNNASRSISFLCKSCRQALVSELPVFLKICSEFQQSQAVTVQSLERVVEGIAAVAEALPSKEAKAPYIEELLRPFFSQSVSAREDAQRGDIEAAHSRAQLALKCIAGIGRGLRADDSKVIDLESEEISSDDNSFWNTSPIQEQLRQCLLVYLDGFPLEHEIIEGICEVLKAGFTEKTGPFVFKPSITAHFLMAIPVGAAGASDVVMSTACSFLASYQRTPEKVQEETASLFIHVYWTFSLMLQYPENYDPEVANSGISFLTRSLPKYHEILFSLTSAPSVSTFRIAAPPPNMNMEVPVLQTILNFVSNALSGREPLPLRSAAQFWVGVLTLPSATNSTTNVSRAIQEYLPSLSHILMTQLSGTCARSDINHLCEVLKKIIFNFQGEARNHLAASLAGPNNTAGGGLSKEQERFLAMVLGARGGSATQEIVRTYWINCRGAGFAYQG